MKVTPRYDSAPLIRLDGDPSAIAAPFLRQRRRFAATLSTLTDDEWAAPSRCEGWTVQDVVAHLIGTDQFWNLSVTSGLAGEPTRYLAAFDPKATPAAMVDAVRGTPPADTLAAFEASSSAFCATVEALDGDGWRTVAEAPAGHIAISALTHHALWDSWVHERDVCLPLGRTPAEEHDEIVASLRFASALAPALVLQSQPDRCGTLAVIATDPDARVVVRVDGDVFVTDADVPDAAFVLEGDAVDVLETLSVRREFAQSIPPDAAWLLAGLREVFETAPS